MGQYKIKDLNNYIESAAFIFEECVAAVKEKGGSASTEAGFTSIPDAIRNIPTGGGGVMKALQILPSNETQNFNPREEGVDGYDWVSAEGYDVDPVMSFMNQIRNGFEPIYHIFARWSTGAATVNGSMSFFDQVTDGDVDSLENINWRNSLDLVELTELDTAKLKDYNNMFNGCSNLNYINPDIHFDISGKQVQYMFEGCRNLTSLPDFTYQQPINLYHFTRGCQNITGLPMMDTSLCTSFNSIIGNWTDPSTGETVDCGVTILPDYDFGAVTSASGTNLGTSSTIRLISGYRNLGKGYRTTQTVNVGAQYQPNLERQSAWNIVNSIWDFNQEGGSGATSSRLNFTGFKSIWGITEEEEAELVAIGAAKGWTVNIS